MKTPTLEERLIAIYLLQNVDNQLQEIHELKGDLPQIVEDLTIQVGNLKSKCKETQRLIKEWKIERDEADVDIISLTEKIEKYKNQQLHVKTNKQYDALAREIDNAEEAISKREKEMEALEGKIQIAKNDLETMTKQLESLESELEEQQKELKEINREHQKEENRLREQRLELLKPVLKEDLEKYERIRKVKGGTAVSVVKRGACGGCFNRIPPQKILEIRQNKKMFTCEHCGRILISEEIVAKEVT